MGFLVMRSNFGYTCNGSCADPESFVREGPTSNFDNFFVVDEGRENPITIISGPSSVRQRNAIKWRFAGVPMIAQH